MRYITTELHDFYCLSCGRKTISLPRERGHQHNKFHRKKLYCPWCHIECNHIEIKNDAERIEFLNDFERGKYNGERESIIRTDGRAWVR